jgi:ubiquinone/menaquinone biosynthesis C-methylase UbiE
VEIENKFQAWEASYRRGENHVFLPADEVIRFISRYVRRRVDIDKFIDISPNAERAKTLDLGCGIGRNLQYGEAMGLEMYGLELSEVAVNKARLWLERSGISGGNARIVQGDVQKLPWPNGYFRFAICDSVLDSMSYTIASDAIAELSRVMVPHGLFYCNLIAPTKSVAGFEEVVETQHEKGTIQSYFDIQRLRELLSNDFSFRQIELHRIEDSEGKTLGARWHLICQKE